MRILVLVLFLVLCIGGFVRAAASLESPPPELAPFFKPPAAFATDTDHLRSPLLFKDGRTVKTAADWARRKTEIRADWEREMGRWPALIRQPKTELLEEVRRENFTQRKLRLEVAPGRTNEVYLLLPEGKGPFPAVLVVYYDPETGAGLGKAGRDSAINW
jgi:hypothetical protein